MQDNLPASQPEIDLLHFLRPLTRLLQKIWEAIKYYFLKLSANWILFFSLIALSGICGALLRYVEKQAFETDAIFVSHVIPANVCTDMLNKLNSPYLSKSGELKISEAATATIRDIESKKLETVNVHRTYDSLLYYNNDSLTNAFRVKLIITDFTYIDTIQQSLIQYLDYSPYSRNRSLARRQALLSLRANLVKKLESMDSVQLLVNNSLQYKRDYANGDPIDPMEGYKAILYFNKQKIAIDQELTTMDNIELLQPFIRYQKSNYPNYLQLFLLAVCVGLGLALVVTPLLGKKPKTE
jgi:hypothetical protein